MNISLPELKEILKEKVECILLEDNIENWNRQLKKINQGEYVPLSCKPTFIEYQTAYFKDVYDGYMDVSMILLGGGVPKALWSVCLWEKDDVIHIGTCGHSIEPPIFIDELKAEGKRKILQKIQDILIELCSTYDNMSKEITTQITVMDTGANQWVKKWMEKGARCIETKWICFSDLSLSIDEIYKRIRRTNRYSVEKGKNEFDIEIYDKDDGSLGRIFDEFHKMHREVSGRETRSQLTWDIQKKGVLENKSGIGYDFVVFIRNKENGSLIGGALFSSTLQTGLYCVAAYDRSKFDRPIGHVVQAVAMDCFRKQGVRWYEIGERSYPGDKNSDPKLVNIGAYKEGFATHIFPRITLGLYVEMKSEKDLA